MNRLLSVLLIVAFAHVIAFQASEPFYINDETRHVMTGAFFHDFVKDGSIQNVKQYATSYYNQYPALGLLIWPPLFHFIEGLWMLVFGLSVTSSKFLVLLFLAVACYFLYRIMRRSHTGEQSLLATALFAFSPMVFELSSQVMLEVPTLALALGSIYFFQLYLDSSKPKQVAAAAAFAVACAMTKYDAFYLLVLFPMLMIGNKPLEILKRKHIWMTIVLAIIAVTPIAYLTARELGDVHLNTIVSSVSDGIQSNWIYYPLSLPRQTGWLTFLLAVTGFVTCWKRENLQRLQPHLAMIAATYIAFAVVAEQEVRHTIYWLPGIAAMAAEGFFWLTRNLVLPRRRWIEATFAALVLLTAVWMPRLYVRGYAQAAQYVLKNGGPQQVLFDGYLNGNFIYQMRLQDPERKTSIVRGDKVLYHAVTGKKQLGYTEYATTPDAIIKTVAANSSRFVVIESRSIDEGFNVADRLREILRTDSTRYRRVAVFPVDTNVLRLEGTNIEIYEQLTQSAKSTDAPGS